MTIGLFLGGIKTEYTSMVLQAITNYVRSRDDITLFCFSVFSIGYNNLLHAEGEKSVFILPDLKQLDGIIVLPDTIQEFGMDKEVVARIKSEADCPVVSIREEVDGFTNILIDNEYAIYDMTKHFIEYHKFKDIRFVAGKMELKDARQRLAGYKKAMAEAGLEVTEDMIFYGNYWKDKGPEIVNQFIKEEEKYPEAIVCANDFMAVSVYEELKKRNIRIPEDICVSGFDDLDESQQLDPPLSSIRVDFPLMGVAAIDSIVKMIKENIKIADSVLIKTTSFHRGSCGCSDPINIRKPDIVEYQTYRNMTQYCIYMGHDYESLMDIDQCIELTGSFAKTFSADSFYMCLFGKAELDEDGNKIKVGRFNSDEVKLKYFYDEECDGKPEVSFKYKDLLPKDYKANLENSICYVVPIHYNTEVYGYAIIKMNNADYSKLQEQYEFLLINFSNGLNRIYTHEELFSMRDIKEMYLKDALTDIYNRRGFNSAISRLYREGNNIKIAFVSIDMDGLKYINDVFGHQCGDDAIVETSKCIVGALKKGEFCARMGGDEFEAVLIIDSESRVEEFYQDVQYNLIQANKKIQADYILDVSIGIYMAETNYSMTECMEEADKLMYKNKNSKKNKQGRR